MSHPLRVLIVGDLRVDADILTSTLYQCGYDATVEQYALGDLTRGADGGNVLVTGSDSMPLLLEHSDHTPVIVLPSTGDDDGLVDAVQRGAYLLLTESPSLLAATIERALRDVEERRARMGAEEELAKSEERYQDLVETANDVVLTIDLQGNFTALNTAGEQISGYSRDEVRQMNMRDVLSPDSYQRATQMIGQKLKDNQPTMYELEMLTRGGWYVPLEVSSRIIYHDGRPVGVHAIARDITERRQAEEELRAREQKQAAVAQLGQKALASADLVALFDDAVNCVAETLDVEFCSIVELTRDGRALASRAGVGWREGVVAHQQVGAGPESQAGYTLLSSEPVVVDDLSMETRFSVPDVLTNHGVTSGISVIIHGPERHFGVLSAFSADRRQFQQDDTHFLQAVANVLAAAVARTSLEEERAQHNKELAARVLQAQEEERKRIARELHDETAQTLSVLLTNLDLLEPHLPQEEGPLAIGFQRVASLAKRALDETRALSHDLRPTILDDAGLVAALEWIAAEYERSYGGTVHLDARLIAHDALSPQAEVALFRIAQEALTNSGKHSRATTVRVSMVVTDEAAELTIKDNGRGFEPDRVDGPTRDRGLGIYGMAERAALFGGTLSITSTPRNGAEIRVRMPLGDGQHAVVTSEHAGIR